LLEQILSGALRGGEVINERRLADQLDVSRTPLRDALKRLEGEGLLFRSADRVLTIRLVTVGDYMKPG
jgi:DNA-binding GntR family transcriptional regulator